MKTIRRVVCALSGGIDSAVAALRLKQKGFDVVGLYMVNWDHLEEGQSECPQTQDKFVAKSICDRLGIEFHVVNFVKIYWNDVFLYTINNYRKGRTVVPDILCNRIIKFQHFHEYAINRLNADAIATGHFARTSFGDFLENRSEKNKEVLLFRGSDPIKDQSYFLSALTQDQLRRSMFPVGSLTKPQVRQIASDANLNEVLNKPESMGICFIGKRKNFSDFIDQYIEPSPGPVRLIDSGETIWHHSGIHHFTIGKRVSVPHHQYRTHFGLFVVSLEYSTQTVWVCEGTYHPSLFATEFVISQPVWIANSPFDFCGNCDEANTEFSLQRTHKPHPCKLIRFTDNLVKLKPFYPVRAAAPGQICAFYRDSECLGCAEIQYVLRTLAD
ncbi:unnamed protein product [Dracunculus medinensis]|uniref:tRNA-5-taurinomethyluridine 2-sulfurtransferase n=1 Tax=Dracunculus medinensis TaxID=318479 RepID=A0A0N4UDW3_DRAME|nr:unnamed protein product [Dracunculus medinensis]